MGQGTRTKVASHNLAYLDAILRIKLELVGIRSLLLASLEVFAVGTHDLNNRYPNRLANAAIKEDIRYSNYAFILFVVIICRKSYWVLMENERRYHYYFY